MRLQKDYLILEKVALKSQWVRTDNYGKKGLVKKEKNIYGFVRSLYVLSTYCWFDKVENWNIMSTAYVQQQTSQKLQLEVNYLALVKELVNSQMRLQKEYMTLEKIILKSQWVNYKSKYGNRRTIWYLKKVSLKSQQVSKKSKWGYRRTIWH